MATGGYGNPTRHTGYESGAMTTRPLWPQEGMEIQQGIAAHEISAKAWRVWNECVHVVLESNRRAISNGSHNFE
ncbi:hypothetical protein TNCV_708781 [Trichonephila clavipes]|nr:hypothetical protein TNCV_708781 [Trichonephila clavipes]